MTQPQTLAEPKAAPRTKRRRKPKTLLVWQVPEEAGHPGPLVIPQRRDLRARYDDLNRRYFDGKLRRPYIFVNTFNYHDAAYSNVDGKSSISVARWVKMTDAYLTNLLLHEMLHQYIHERLHVPIWFFPKHGVPFYAVRWLFRRRHGIDVLPSGFFYGLYAAAYKRLTGRDHRWAVARPYAAAEASEAARPG